MIRSGKVAMRRPSISNVINSFQKVISPVRSPRTVKTSNVVAAPGLKADLDDLALKDHLARKGGGNGLEDGLRPLISCDDHCLSHFDRLGRSPWGCMVFEVLRRHRVSGNGDRSSSLNRGETDEVGHRLNGSFHDDLEVASCLRIPSDGCLDGRVALDAVKPHGAHQSRGVGTTICRGIHHGQLQHGCLKPSIHPGACPVFIGDEAGEL